MNDVGGCMVRENKTNQCYKKDSSSGVLLPDDENHNCELFHYDEEDHSYISNFLMRKVVNLGVVASTVILGVKFINSPVFHETRDIFLYGGVFSLGYVMMANNLPIKFVDGIYAATGIDLVWGMTDDINDTIYVATYLPRMLWSYFTSPSPKKDTLVTPVSDDVDDTLKGKVMEAKDFSNNMEVVNDSKPLEIQNQIGDSSREIISNFKASISEICVSCEIGDIMHGDFFRFDE
jgi:hypothetical protein